MNNPQRILVIDDGYYRISNSLQLFGTKARNLLVVDPKCNLSTKMAKDFLKKIEESFSVEAGAEEEIARALKEETYRTILLDGNLGLNLEREYFDGKIIARKLRDGEYGNANQQTSILSTSDSPNAIPQADGLFRMEYVTPKTKDLARRLLED